MAIANADIYIYSNDGSESIWYVCGGYDDEFENIATFTVTETGLMNAFGSYTYEGDKKFIGFSTVPDAVEPEYAIGDTFTVKYRDSLLLYIVEEEIEEETTGSITFDLSTLNLSPGTHTITVKARASGYADSAESNAVDYVVEQQSGGGSGEVLTLFTPSISLYSVTGVLTIIDDQNGDFVQGYNLYIDDEFITVLTSKEVTLTDYIEHTETLEIKVQAVGANFNPSEYSNVITWEYVNATGTPGLAYSISSDGTYATCTGIGDAVETDIEIASVYGGVAVTQIASEAFKSQTKLNSVIIPPTVERINSSAFISCSSIKSLVISDGVKYIYSEAFMWCSSLTSIVIPDSVTSVGDRVFVNCSGLTNVVISKSVKSIPKQVFANCTNLTTITIPSNVSNLGQWAFSGCSNLKRVDISTHTSIPTLGTAVFQTTHTDLQIKVPASLIDEWKSATNWSNYASKIVTEFTNEV